MIHHPDFYKPDDDRPQFACLPQSQQLDIIAEFAEKHPEDYKSYVNEACSQLPAGSDVFDLWKYIAACIVNKHDEQEDWTL